MKYLAIVLVISGLLLGLETPNKKKLDDQHLHCYPQLLNPLVRSELLDSTGNGYTLWTNVHESISFNPFQDYLMVINRALVPSAFLNAHYAPGNLSYWDHTPDMYQGDFGPARYPTAVVTNTHLYTSFAAIDPPFDAFNWVIERTDTFFPVIVNFGNLYPRQLHKVITKELDNGNLLSVGVTEDTIFYKTVTPNLDSIISDGIIAEGHEYWGFDINGGIANIFFHDTLIDTNIYYKTTIDGVNWSSEEIWNLTFTPPYPSTKIIWTQMSLTDDGFPRLVFDAINSSDTTYPWYGKIYVSHTSGVPPVELTAALGDTETIYPTIACGGGKAVAIFNVPRNNLSDSLNWWDIFYCYSTDNGITWSGPINLTESNSARIGLQQIAKRIDVLRNQFFYIYAIDAVVNHDPLWHVWGEIGSDWMYICFDHASITGIEEEQLSPTSQKSNIFEFYPNPFKEKLNITYYTTGLNSISLKVYDVIGRLVKRLYRGIVNGYRTLTWDGVDNNGKTVSQGVYFIHVENLDSNEINTHKVLKVR